MSHRTATRLLFGVFFLLLPIPFFLMGGVAWAPLLRLSALAGLMSVLGFVDGVEGLMAVALAVVLVQCAIFSVGLWFAAEFLVRAVRRSAGERLQGWVVGGIALILVVASFFPIYTTPMSSTARQANVLEILD